MDKNRFNFTEKYNFVFLSWNMSCTSSFCDSPIMCFLHTKTHIVNVYCSDWLAEDLKAVCCSALLYRVSEGDCLRFCVFKGNNQLPKFSVIMFLMEDRISSTELLETKKLVTRDRCLYLLQLFFSLSLHY